MNMPARRSRWRRHAGVLLLYFVLSLALTYPLITRLASYVPGDGIDDPALAWNLWWLKFSLVDRQVNPFASSWMFYPLGINLAFYTLTILNGLLSVPLQTALNLVLASNLVLLSSFVLSGYGAYLLAATVLVGQRNGQQPDRHILHLAAFSAGLLYAFSSSKLFYAALGQFNIASSQWIPFAALYVLRSTRPGAGLREPLLAALFILLQAYAELTYASFLVIFVGLVATYRLVQALQARGLAGGQPIKKSDRSSLARAEPRPSATPVPRGVGPASVARLVRNLAIMALVVAVGLTPILANMLPDMQAEGDFFVEGEGFADIFSADLAGYGFPTQLHPLLGDLIRKATAWAQLRFENSLWQVDKGQHLTLGALGLGLALLGLWTGRRRTDTTLWGASALLFFLLTLGPTVRVAGVDTGIPGPFQLVQMLPFFKGNRYPSRYSVMLLVSVAPLIAIGLAWLLARIITRLQKANATPTRLVGATTLLAAVLLFENLSAPLPLSDMSVPRLYETIAAGQGVAAPEAAVLDLPLGWRNGFSVFGKQDLIIMAQQWWQTTHERPILGGNTSRNPEHKFRYFLEAPLIGPLTVLANADDAHPHIRDQLQPALDALREGDASLGGNEMLISAAASASQVMTDLNTTHVIVHRDHVPPEFLSFIESYLPVTLLVEEGEHRLYRAELDQQELPLTRRPALAGLTRGEGWSGQPEATATPAVPEPTLWAHRKRTRLVMPPVPAAAADDERVITVRARAAGPDQSLRLLVNGHATEPSPLSETWAEVSFAIPAGRLQPAPNDIVLQFDRSYLVDDVQRLPDAGSSLLVESAGLEAGDYAHIWLNGTDVSPNGRGYNLAIIDRETWQPRLVGHFDTHGDPAASQDLVRFLEQLDAESVLAVAVKDTASDQLSAEAAQALAGLGLSDLRGRFRWSQAALVLPAAEPGALPQVVEQVDGLQSTSVGLGPGWREPQVAAEVAWIRID